MNAVAPLPTRVLPARDREHERVLGQLYNLSPAQAAVLSCLSRSDSGATTDELEKHTDTKPPIKVVVSRVRSKIKEKDASLDIQSKQRLGYWMLPECRATVAAEVEKFLA